MDDQKPSTKPARTDSAKPSAEEAAGADLVANTEKVANTANSVTPRTADQNAEDLLLQAALRGDAAAFESLVLQHQDRLYNSMIQVTGSTHDAEEVTQEAFIRAFMKLDTFQGNSQFFTWLYRVAFNIALSRKRRRKVRVSLDQQRDDLGTEVVDHTESVDAGLIRDDQVNLVQTALHQLTDEHRSILVLREMNESSYEEMAEILELSIGTVRSRLNRARKQLRITIENLQRDSSGNTDDEEPEQNP